jgi:ribosomal protein L5
MDNLLAEAMADFKGGKIDKHAVDALANLAGKRISLAKTQIAYFTLREEMPNIPNIGDGIEVKAKATLS